MQPLSLLAAVAIGILLDTAWVALFRARPVGRFQVVRDTPKVFTVRSGHGTFSIDAASQALQYSLGKQRGTLKLSEISGLAYRADEEYALLEEFFFGFDMADLLPKYRDTVTWFSIAVVASDGRRIPVYLSGQYTPREYLLGWYIDLQAAVLSRLGLLVDVEARSREALALLQARLGQPKLL